MKTRLEWIDELTEKAWKLALEADHLSLVYRDQGNRELERKYYTRYMHFRRRIDRFAQLAYEYEQRCTTLD